MQTRKEVKDMHAAITRAALVFVILILTAVAAVFLSPELAPFEHSAMPPLCPPAC